MTIFWVKSSIILYKLNNNIIFNFVIIVATIKGRTKFVFHHSLYLLFFDRDGQISGSGINIPDPQHCFFKNLQIKTTNLKLRSADIGGGSLQLNSYLHCRNHAIDGAVQLSAEVIGVVCKWCEDLREDLQQ